MLYYVPLESYKERYTSQLSAPEVGWVERKLIAKKISYCRVEGSNTGSCIKSGVVLDAVRRCNFAMSQISVLLSKAENGSITGGDIIFFDDFWHPGIESLAYAFHILGVQPKMYAFCYAQSVDEYDFTYPMRGWIRSFEKGIGSILDGVFVANTLLRDLLVDACIAPVDKIHVVGLIFDSAEVRSRMRHLDRLNQVVYCSRWDKEKCPDVFLRIVDCVMACRDDVKFVVCSGSDKVRSNSDGLLSMLYDYEKKYPRNLFVKSGLSKELYYGELCKSKIQINTADQDWVSFTLLESSVAGCFPVYPNFRSFPETFNNRHEYLYVKSDCESAANKINTVIDNDDNWSVDSVNSRSWIHRRFDNTLDRILAVMGASSKLDLPLYG